MFYKTELDHTTWMKILPVIAPLLEGTGAIPEDVYHSIKTENSFLFTNEDGFLIMQEQRQEFTGDKELFVWLGSRWDTQVGLIEKYQEWIISLAKDIHAKKITFASKRLGFSRILGEPWKLRTAIYEMEIK